MKLERIGLIALFFGLLYGCSELNTGNELDNQKSGSVIIKLTDAPFPSDRVDSVLVTIDWIKLKKSGEESDDESSEEGAASSFTMIEVDTTVNLLELSNGISMVLGELDDVPIGEYSEIRMHVTEATVVYDLEKRDVIKIPSGNTSGLKIKISPALEVGGFNPAVVLIDFDASRSFLVKGNPFNNGNKKQEITGFKFKPVIRAVPLAHTGEVSGTVKDTISGSASADPIVLSGAKLHLIYNGGSTPDTIFALSGDDGKYKIIGVPKGEYVLICGKETHDTLSQNIIIENDGDKVTADFLLTKAEETEDETPPTP